MATKIAIFGPPDDMHRGPDSSRWDEIDQEELAQMWLHVYVHTASRALQGRRTNRLAVFSVAVCTST